MADLVIARRGAARLAPVGVSGGALDDQADAFAALARSEATQRAYRSDWKVFGEWCGRHGLQAWPASEATVRAFVADQALAGSSPATLARRLAAISVRYRMLPGVANPVRCAAVADTLAGVRRAWAAGGGRARRAAALEGADLCRVVDSIGVDAPLDVRDRALLLLGFSAALRRSELVALRWIDLEPVPGRGLYVRVRMAKSDQGARGATVAVPAQPLRARCPVAALERWRRAYALAVGVAGSLAPVFVSLPPGRRSGGAPLSPQSVRLVLRRRARAAGLDPAGLSAHSLRSGFVTSAVRAGAAIDKVREVTRHRSYAVLAGYVREADLFRDHAGAALLGADPPPEDAD